MENAPFKLYIQLPRGYSSIPNVTGNTLVKELKKSISEKEKIPIKSLELFCSGVPLHDNDTLKQYKITARSAITVEITESSCKIFIRFPQGDKKKYKVNKYEAVHRIKERIQREGIPYISIKLSYDNKVLDNDRTLESYGISNDANITFSREANVGSQIYVRTINRGIKEFEFDPKKRVRDLEQKIVELDNIEIGWFDLKYDGTTLKFDDSLTRIVPGSLLICEIKISNDVVKDYLSSKTKELMSSYKEKLEPFIGKLKSMDIEGIDPLFEKAKKIIKKAKDLSLLVSNVTYNREYGAIVKAKNHYVDIKSQILSSLKRIYIIKENCINLFQISSQTFQKKSNEIHNSAAETWHKAELLKLKNKADRILNIMEDLKRKTEEELNPLTAAKEQIEKRINGIDKFLSDKEKSIDKKIERKKRHLEISKDLILIRTEAKDCLQPIETNKIDSVHEGKLFDIAGIAKAVEAKTDDWLTKEEKRLNEKLETDEFVELPKSWIKKEEVKEEVKKSLKPLKISEEKKEEIKEVKKVEKVEEVEKVEDVEDVEQVKKDKKVLKTFCMKLVKKGLESEDREVVFTNSHRMSTLNIHNVHLLSSTYRDSQKARIRIHENNEEIFTDPEKKAEFIRQTKEKIAKELGVDAKYVNIVDMKRGSIELNIVLHMIPEEDIGDTEEFRDKIRRQNDKSRRALSDDAKGEFENCLKKVCGKIEFLKTKDIFSTFVFDTNYLDPDYDLEYNEKTNKIFRENMIDKRGKFPYYLPIGFRRLGVHVKGVYDNNDDWLDNKSNKGWAVAYHGISAADSNPFEDAQKIIISGVEKKQGFLKAKRAVYGQGVYCAPDVRVAEDYAAVGELKISDKKTMKYKLIFQCRVNSHGKFACSSNQEGPGTEDVYVIENAHVMREQDQEKGKGEGKGKGKEKEKAICKDYWLVRDPRNVRPYGILIKIL